MTLDIFLYLLIINKPVIKYKNSLAIDVVLINKI